MATTYSSSSARAALEALAQRLREIRTDAGLTCRALAGLAGWHESKVSKVEHGRQAPRAHDIREWCLHCNASPQAEDLIAALRSIESTFVQWKRLERTGLRHAQTVVLPLWEATSVFRAYSCGVIPGILQTRDYTQAVLSAIRRHRQVPDDVDAALEVRMGKQAVLHHAGKRFVIVIEEAALRQRMVASDVMAGQLAHLITVMSLPAVSLGIIPCSICRARSPAEDFWVYDDSRVSVELVSGWLNVTSPAEVALYVQAHQELSALAINGKAARDVITTVIRDLT